MNIEIGEEDGASKLNTYSDGFKVIRTIMKLYKNYKPFKFFAYFSFILAFIGTILFTPIFIEYIKTGLVPKIPTLLVSMFFYLSTVLSYFSGMILQTIVDNTKQEFEIELNEWEDRLKRDGD